MSKPTVDQYITKRLEYLDRFIYHHECNIPEPNFQEQSEYHEVWGERQALRKVRELLGEPTIKEEGISFDVSSGFGHNTQAPYVQVLIQSAFLMTQMSPADARRVAHNLLEAADAAESDGFLVGFLQKAVGVKDMRAIVTILMEFREYREQQRGESS